LRLAEPAKPGIYFLSLDADSRAAVAAARRSYRLPYFHSRISAGSAGEGFHFDSTRTSSDGPAAYFVARYGPRGQPIPIRDGSLERWLTERYCLYTLDGRQRSLRERSITPLGYCGPPGPRSRPTRWSPPLESPSKASRCCTFARQDVTLWSLSP
jgi:uncharacterized protein YqjF (DUF2071 family)